MSNKPSQTGSFDGIQYLRAIAALMVVAHHARHFFGEVATWSTFGSHGVAIFFVISGFIMVHATRGFDPSQKGSGQALDFFVRRAIRVVPLYWLALLYQNKRAIFEGRADFGLLSDFVFIPRFNIEFSSHIWPSLVPGWTINYEMAFYVLFGAALLFGRWRYLALVSALAGLVLVGALWTFESAPAQFWTASVIGEFALGIGVYHLMKSTKWVPKTWQLVCVFLAGFVGLAIPNLDLPTLVAYGPFAAMIVWSGAHLGQLVKPQKWLLLIGDASYSIYLSHLFTFNLGFKIYNALKLSEPTPFNIAAAILILTSIATVVGIAVHFLLEKPLMRVMQAWWRNFRQPALKPQRV